MIFFSFGITHFRRCLSYRDNRHYIPLSLSLRSSRSLSLSSPILSPFFFFINLNYIQLSVSHTRLLENHQYVYANFSDFANFKSLKLKPCARIKKKIFCDTFILSEFPI